MLKLLFNRKQGVFWSSWQQFRCCPSCKSSQYFFKNETSSCRSSRLVNLTIICTLALRDLRAFIYIIPSILSIHSAVTPVKHSARHYQFQDKIHFFGVLFLQPLSCLKPSSVVYWISRSACSPNFLIFLFPGTCLFLHLRYTPLWGKKKSNDKTLLSEAVWSYSMW